MFEMFATILAAVLATLYGLSRSVFMVGPYRNYYRFAALAIIVFIYLAYRIRHDMRRFHLRQLHVDVKDYIYYEKYTSLLYRAGYLISYLIQNILFDYIYMRRNFNFCKGLDVYDGGVSEYYIKFRGTWYQYLKVTLLRHKVSLQKLQAYASDVKNEMILNALETDEEKKVYLNFSEEARQFFEEHNSLMKDDLKTFPDFHQIDSYYWKNILKNYEVILSVRKYEPEVKDMVDRLNKRGNDDITNFKKKKF
ncbi:MAG: hypothetical protein LUF92_16990 [Clostridiales bacterium]|nr:hypothetical protein [Clostridiales bacterium]